MTVTPVTPEAIEAAADRIRPLVRATPALTVPGSELGLDPSVTVTLKLELLQHSGTFKARGASNALLTADVGDAGVVAASGGNHGAAVAWAASVLGHRATIFVPTISAPAKVDRLRSYGADVHQVGEVYAESLAASVEFQRSSGAVAVHAYEDPAVVAGAGTTGRELERQAAGAAEIFVACGGGGLAGGIAAWFGPPVTVVACETRTTATFAAALDAGHPVDVEVSGLAADALGASRLGRLAWHHLSAAGARSALVDDDEVAAAQAWLWDRFRLVTEPSAAVPIAALRSGRHDPAPGTHVAVVVCGANTSIGL
ncbi:MAG: serine/threonine dehydratase [Acidimicrobiales bacterium]